MGKFASFIRNLTLISIAGLLAHLAYRLYDLSMRLSILIDKLTFTNTLIRELHNLVKNLKISIF